MIPYWVDQIALVGAAFFVLLKGEEWLAALVMLGNWCLVSGYETITGGSAVESGVYILADVVSLFSLLLMIAIMGRARTGMLVLLGFFVCVMLHGLHLLDMIEITAYWTACRVVNALQIIALGGSVCGTGKGFRGPRAFHLRGRRGILDDALALQKRKAK